MSIIKANKIQTLGGATYNTPVQVVNTPIYSAASYSLNGAGWQSTVLTSSITPRFNTSLIVIDIMATINSNSSGQGLFMQIRRGDGTILQNNSSGYPIHWLNTNSLPNVSAYQLCTQSWHAYDSPATTSSTSYTVFVYGVGGTGSLLVNQNVNYGSSYIRLTEIAQ